MEDLRRIAPRLRCPSCGGLVSLATGVVNLATGEREAVCWSCGSHVRWTDSTPTVDSVDEYGLS